MRVESLTSSKNPLLKDVRRAIARGALTEDGFAVAETFHLLEEALRSDSEVKAVLVAESIRSAVENHVRGLSGPRVIAVPDELFRELSSTQTAQGVVALVRPPAWTLDQIFRGKSLVVVLDGVQDPGNAGSIVRAAEAFGASGIAFLKGSVNPYNPKCVRASAGSLFRVPCIAGVEERVLQAAIAQHRLDVYAAVVTGERTPNEIDLTRRCALIIGSEGHGVSHTLRSAATGLRIPTSGVESLNAAVAAGILLYEARRQRTAKSS
ncbi:MAG TPA: RNA methyltransferase [Bryobacteraceae bacterium]|nr:RNA methyltransferase [Bryobacteraceae bacterium]